MKKILYTLSLVMMIILSSFLASACKEPQATKIEVKEGSIATSILLNEDLDTSKLVVKVSFDNDKTVEVAKNDNMKFSTIDNTKIGTQTFVIKYLGLETSINIAVVARAEDSYDIIGFNQAMFYTTYKDNIKVQNDNVATKDFDESENTFTGEIRKFMVGDDNKFVYLPIITVIDQDGNDYVSESYLSNVKVELYENNEWKELTGTELTDLVEIDNINSTFDFTEEAISKVFKITTLPLFNTADLDPLSIEVEVVDGWNVYTPADLSRFANASKVADDWAEYKKQNNVGSEAINALVFQNDLKLSIADLPKAYIYDNKDADNTAELEGSLRDRISLYVRDIAESSTFTIYGNYFTLDISKIPLVESLRETSSHSVLFDVGGDNNNSLQDKVHGNFVVDSLKMIGNAGREERDELVGGMIGFISSAKNFKVNNSNIRKFLVVAIHVPGHNNTETSNIYTDTNVFDSYSDMFYCWKTKKNEFYRCTLKGSGGPIFMATHVDPGDTDNPNQYSNITINDCIVDSPIAGNEAWFILFEADNVVTGIKALNQPFLNLSTQLKAAGIISSAKGFLKNNQFNLIGTILSNGSLDNTTPLQGEIKIIEHEVMKADLKMDNAKIKDLWAATSDALKAAPFFESNGVLMTTTTGSDLKILTSEGLVDITDILASMQTENPNTEGLELIINFFSGDYFILYQAGNTLGVVAEFYDITE